MHDDSPTGPAKFMYQNGFNTWTAYGVPGRPFLTGTLLSAGEELKISFPTVTKSIAVVASGSAPLRVHFDTTSSTDVVSQHRYITLVDSDIDPASGRFDFDIRATEVYVSAPTDAAGFELCAICVQVSGVGIQSLSGSGINAN